MRIAHVSDCYLPRTGGIETQVRSLALQQRAAGHDVRVITATPGHLPVRSGRDRVDDLPVDRVAARLPFELPVHPRTRHHVAQLLRSDPVDIVHVHAGVISPFAWGGVRAALEVGTPVLVTVHSVWDGPQRAGFSVAESVLRWRRRGVVLSAVSELAAARVGHALGLPVLVTPNGIDPGAWHVDTWVPSAGDLRVVSVMRMAPRKRTLPLVRMLARACSRLDGAVSALLIGDGPERTAAQRLAGRLGVEDRVRFLGRLDRDGILSAFGHSDVFLQPSIQESFGIAALEARTAGLAVIARSQSGTTQFIHDGVEGLLGDSDAALVDALVMLGSDRETLQRLSQHNRSIVPVEEWPRVLGAVQQAYEQAQASAV